MIRRKSITIAVLFFVFIFIFNSSSTEVDSKKIDDSAEKVTVYVNNFKNQKSNFPVELSLIKAEKIKNQFLEIEKNLNGIDKINKQIQILKEIDFLPSDFSVDDLLSNLYYYKSHNLLRSSISFLKLSMGGPLIVSHLTIGGRIQCLFSLKSIYYNSTKISLGGNFNNSCINRVFGILPIYVGTAFTPVFVTIVGPNIVKSSKIYFFSFFEILVPCVGFSIAFVYLTKNSHPVTLFEYNLDACLWGAIAGF